MIKSASASPKWHVSHSSCVYTYSVIYCTLSTFIRWRHHALLTT